MGHEYLAGTLVERREVAKTSARANGVLHHAPAAFNGVEVMATMSGEEMEAQLALRVVEGRVELMGSMKAAPLGDRHD